MVVYNRKRPRIRQPAGVISAAALAVLALLRKLVADGPHVVDIAAPDYETRAVILNREIQASDLGIDPAIASLIAGRVDSNVRELKGALNQVVAMRAIMGMDVTEDAVRQMLDSRYAKA